MSIQYYIIVQLYRYELAKMPNLCFLYKKHRGGFFCYQTIFISVQINYDVILFIHVFHKTGHIMRNKRYAVFFEKYYFGIQNDFPAIYTIAIAHRGPNISTL